MSKLKRQEAKPPVYLLNDSLLRKIDSVIAESPVFFRQKDAETYFDNPFLLGGLMESCFLRACQYYWFSPRYRTMRFDSRHMRPYTNEELINLFELPSDFLSEAAKYFDSLEVEYWKQ